MNPDFALRDKIEFLKKVPIFSELTTKELDRLAQVAHRRSYTKDQLILIEAEAGQTLFVLMSGQVKISRVDDQGREVVLAVMASGDFFGELALIDGLSRSANVTVLQNSEMLLINRDDFLQLLRECPSIAINLLKILAGRIRKSDTQIKSLSLKNSTGKVTSTILRLAEDIGIRDGDQITIPHIPTQQDLANMAGTSRETISRMINRLISEGYLEKKGNALVIISYEKFKKNFS